MMKITRLIQKITNNTLNHVRPIENIDENAVISGMWEDLDNIIINIIIF